MKTVRVDTQKKYEILIGSSILSFVGQFSVEKTGKGKALVVTDDIVNELYSDTVCDSLKKAGYSVYKYVFVNGEKSKTFENYLKILQFLYDNQFTRSDCVFALGGGVVGDIAGFCAATFLRGIKFIQVPTTLLAAVDSSVGGKTAVNFNDSKNAVGAFYQPDAVFCDYSVLDSLNEINFADGMAEIIKCGVICDKPLFDSLENPTKPQLEKIITRCIEIKRDVVLHDEFDTGIRNVLNLGHTFGHAIEKCSKHEITHGHAVSIGMAIMTKAAVKKGICKQETLDRLLYMLEKYKLPVSTKFNSDEIFDAVLSDKKRDGNKINLIVPEKIGSVKVLNVSLEEAKSFLFAGNGDNG